MKSEKILSEPTAPTNLNFDMLINDFGPIKKAAISLRPLTVFIGGNNMGKSYAAMLVHSVISTGRNIRRPVYPHASSTLGVKGMKNLWGRLEKVIVELKSKGKADCPPHLTSQIVRMCVEEYQVILEREIMRNFGSGLSELTRSGTDHFSLDLKLEKHKIISYKKGKLGLRPLPKFCIKFKISKSDGLRGIVQADWDDSILYCGVEDDVVNTTSARSLLPHIYSGLKPAILQQAIATLPEQSRYFPAARSGILQAHRVITSNIVRNAPYAGIEDIHVPRLSGVVSDFVSSIIDLHPIRGAHHDIGKEIEKDIFGGQIKLKYVDPGTIPEIYYEHSKVAVPIHRTSSTISEMAPFTLHLKHRLRGNGVLTIEEPEAHLHPSKQSLLAKHIVKLVREGANIIITTHSSTLFESISHSDDVKFMELKTAY